MNNPFPPPEDEDDRRLLHNVQTQGWHVLHVGGATEDDPNVPDWSYSIGLFHTFGHPELIVVGLPFATAQAILDGLGSRIKAGQRFDHGMRDSEVLTNHDVRFITMRRGRNRSMLGYAFWFYRGKEFPVLQVVWPDRAGRFPGDPACALDDFTQPILGRMGTDLPS